MNNTPRPDTTPDTAVVIQAAACVLLDAALNLIQADPHQPQQAGS